MQSDVYRDLMVTKLFEMYIKRLENSSGPAGQEFCNHHDLNDALAEDTEIGIIL